ncbi:antibiotic biosynthesis monooxygenase [Flammeovirga pectinis]|uniref:Antibiotic biosynthesis monooxygenase n=1 Tax=Flammeovirga pectinis TaxID=2494373 RepID=A0A3S9P047_9BACT|nr:antibiotic biosynthesis monooxygenase family protein [Flammeovirga pectinis]AZQ61568.1 antibiotic biosynthesis monooxygenase [Flammeovirga pectinis]
MLHRFVRMSFQEDKIEDFKEMFTTIQSTIEAFEGCHSVILLQDKDGVNKFMTFSIWDDEEALNNYRGSDFFKQTWVKTKKMFNDKPEAFSMYKP